MQRPVGNYNQSMYHNLPDYSSSDEEEKIKVPKQKIGLSLAGWKDLFLKEEIMRAIRQCGFQHPSQVQNQAIPHILEGHDLICQAKSGMGKTAVFVISILNMIAVERNGQYMPHQCLVICHCRELAHQILKDFRRLSKYFKYPPLRSSCYFGGISIQENTKELCNADTTPHIIVATPGRLIDLSYKGFINLKRIKWLVVDECDKLLSQSDSRADLEFILQRTPNTRQILMFSATFDEEIKKQCKKIMINPVIIAIDQGQLILHGLSQFYIRVSEEKKFERLSHLLDNLAFNQVIIFVNKVERAKKLTDLLKMKLFNPICIHSSLRQQQRIRNYDLFKANGSRLLVATDLFGRGIDIERVNLVINYDFPYNRDIYLHRVGRAGRFGTKGMAVSFILLPEQDNKMSRDQMVLMDVQNGFKVKVLELPKKLDISLYM